MGILLCWQVANASPFLRRNIWPIHFKSFFIIKSLCTALITSLGQSRKWNCCIFTLFLYSSASFTEHWPCTNHFENLNLEFYVEPSAEDYGSIYFPCLQNLKVLLIWNSCFNVLYCQTELVLLQHQWECHFLQSVSAYSTWASLFILIYLMSVSVAWCKLCCGAAWALTNAPSFVTATAVSKGEQFHHPQSILFNNPSPLTSGNCLIVSSFHIFLSFQNVM